MKLLLLTLEIVMVIVLSVAVRIFGYDRQCPHSSQRGFRVHSECSGNSSVYNCLYNTKNKTYTEFCEKNEEARAGLKYVISGTYRNVKCSEERYQPFTFWTNRSTNCLYLKSPCSETGQLVVDNTSTIGDSSCRCDYTRHYAFVSLPRNPCFCKPSVEDCICYIKQCPNNTTLSPDYECMYLNSTKKSFNCNPVFHTRTNGSDIDTLPRGTEQLKPQIKSLRTTLAIKIVCIGLIAVILVVMYVTYDKISVDQSDLKYNDGNKINSDNIHAHNIKIESQSNAPFPITNSLLSESDIKAIRQPNNIEISLKSACRGGDLSIVNSLIERGADINITDDNGETATTWASRSGNNDEVNLLLDKVSNEHKFNDIGKPALEKGSDNEDIVRDEGSDISPQEQNMAENLKYLLPFAGSSDDFYKLLSTGTYESFENRVFLCGSCACGKSTLASVLIGSTIPLTWKSTDGLVIHFGRNGINLETHEMVPLTGGYQTVLTKVVIGKPNRETVICQSVNTNQGQHIAPSSTGPDFHTSNQQAIKKETGNSSKVFHSSDVSVEESKDLQVTNTMTSNVEKTTSISLPKINKIEANAVRDDILKEIKNGQYKVKIAPSDLVDFGGQRSYDMTHQLFVQHGGTFVVMFDGSKDFLEPLKEYPSGDISNETIVEHWVNSILTYCVDESGVDDVMPMIVFAATHSDLIYEKKQEKMKKEFAEKVTKMFGTHEMKKHIVFNPVYFINGTNEADLEIQNLKDQLVRIAVNQSSWRQRRPMIWVPLELLIDNMKKDQINVILKTHLAEANTQNGDLSLSEKQLDDFLLTQHALGKLIYFNQPELNSFIILYPPALVNILKSFVTDEMFWPKDKTLKDILRKMTDTGIIKKRDLLKLWQQKHVNQYLSCDEIKEYVIQVLVHLDILVLPKRNLGKTNADDYFLVPCTAKNKMPMSFLEDRSFAKKTITLVYKLRKRFIPSSLTFKLIGAVSGIWPIKEENGRPLLYHSAAVLYVDSKTEFRIIIENTRVVVYLTHEASIYIISPDIAASIQECLTFTLNDVLKFYLSSIGKSHNNKDISNLFQIEVGEVCDRSPCVVSVSEAKRTSSWNCSRNIHFTKYPLLWIFDKTQEECPTDCTGLHVDALEMLPSDKHLVRLASQLDIDSCKRLVLHLGLQEIHWKNVNHAYGHDALTLNTMVLYTWMNTKIKGKSKTKSLNNLHAGLKAIGADTHVLCKVFREYTDFSEFPNVGPDEVPNDDVLKNLPQKLGNCALQLGVELGIAISSIEQTKTDHRKMYDQTEDILRKWKNSTEEKPTLFKLLVGLERVHLGGFQFVKDMYLRK